MKRDESTSILSVRHLTTDLASHAFCTAPDTAINVGYVVL